MKQRFEHKKINLCSDMELKEAEQEGWEICGITPNFSNGFRPLNPTIWFKRPINFEYI